MDLLGEIDRRGRETPHRLAHRGGGRELSYGELLARSDTLAAYLAATLPDDGTPVAVLGHKEPEMVVAFLACAKAGHPFVPLDTAAPPQRIERIVTVAQAPLTLTPDRIAELTARDAPAPGRPPRDQDPFYIMFTSGSTGDPKGVLITRGNITAFVEWMLAEHRPVPSGEVILDQTTFSFDVSMMGLLPG
ncbi:MAG TPA: AMP-binding protein, partial [Gemmatimonadales bacterium]|nr:AMP-binding protein [Gemmatimonadales bacterium]